MFRFLVETNVHQLGLRIFKLPERENPLFANVSHQYQRSQHMVNQSSVQETKIPKFLYKLDWCDLSLFCAGFRNLLFLSSYFDFVEVDCS